MFGLPIPSLSGILGGVALLAIIGAGWERYQVVSLERDVAQQQTALTRLTDDNGTLRGNYAACKKGSDDLQASADAAIASGKAIQAALDKAHADAVASQKATAVTIAALRSKPAPAPDMACAAAFDVLRGKM